jgi:hypothetical protein
MGCEHSFLLGHAKLIWGFRSATDPNFEKFRKIYYNILKLQQETPGDNTRLRTFVTMIAPENAVVLCQIFNIIRPYQGNNVV